MKEGVIPHIAEHWKNQGDGDGCSKVTENNICCQGGFIPAEFTGYYRSRSCCRSNKTYKNAFKYNYVLFPIIASEVQREKRSANNLIDDKYKMPGSRFHLMQGNFAEGKKQNKEKYYR